MAVVPVASGMTLCDYLIIESKTGKASLIGSFAEITAPVFPQVPAPFSVVATLTGGLGDVTIDVAVSRLETGDEIATYQNIVHFPHKLKDVLYHLRLKQLMFPAPGHYQFTMTGNGEWIAQKRVRLKEKA
jgi:hypothetical protein